MKSVSLWRARAGWITNTSSGYQYEYGTGYASCYSFSCTAKLELKGPTDIHMRYK